MEGVKAFVKSITLFEFVVAASVFWMTWAVVQNYPTDKLTVIGVSVGVTIWGRIKGQQ